VKALRLRCECERNLADVTKADSPGGFVVTPRSGVTMRLWSPPNKLADWHSVTYIFDCRCGKPSQQVRGGSIFNEWSHRQHERGVVPAILGRNL
jgi:hypothetical protein